VVVLVELVPLPIHVLERNAYVHQTAAAEPAALMAVVAPVALAALESVRPVQAVVYNRAPRVVQE